MFAVGTGNGVLVGGTNVNVTVGNTGVLVGATVAVGAGVGVPLMTVPAAVSTWI